MELDYANFFNYIFQLMPIFAFFLLAFWLWGQIFIIHSNVIYPLFFLILRTISLNVQLTVFIIAILLLSFESLYIPKELLIIFLTIINFFPVFKKNNNQEYIKLSIKLICLAICIFIDIFLIKSVNITIKYILENRDTNIFLLGLLFTKTLIHSCFYTILLSCFYIFLNDYFYKDKAITYKELIKRFVENLNKYSYF